MNLLALSWDVFTLRNFILLALEEEATSVLFLKLWLRLGKVLGHIAELVMQPGTGPWLCAASLSGKSFRLFLCINQERKTYAVLWQFSNRELYVLSSCSALGCLRCSVT